MKLNVDNKLGKPTIIIAKDHVLICGQIIVRPTGISPSQWMWFWERVHSI